MARLFGWERDNLAHPRRRPGARAPAQRSRRQDLSRDRDDDRRRGSRWRKGWACPAPSPTSNGASRPRCCQAARTRITPAGSAEAAPYRPKRRLRSSAGVAAAIRGSGLKLPEQTGPIRSPCSVVRSGGRHRIDRLDARQLLVVVPDHLADALSGLRPAIEAIGQAETLYGGDVVPVWITLRRTRRRRCACRASGWSATARRRGGRPVVRLAHLHRDPPFGRLRQCGSATAGPARDVAQVKKHPAWSLAPSLSSAPPAPPPAAAIGTR